MKYTNEISKENLRKVHERLYRCRDLEISNLWQRSIFLSVFMVLCFTAYGYLIAKILDFIKTDQEYGIMYLNCAAVALASISCIFSYLWICMAKASKAWYEVYEKSVTEFEKEYYVELGIPYKYTMGKMSPFKVDKNILSTNGGAFSPSRINIIIGIVCLIIWSAIAIVHSILLFFRPQCVMQVIVLSIIIMIIIIIRQCDKINSSYLSDYEE